MVAAWAALALAALGLTSCSSDQVKKTVDVLHDAGAINDAQRDKLVAALDNGSEFFVGVVNDLEQEGALTPVQAQALRKAAEGSWLDALLVLVKELGRAAVYWFLGKQAITAWRGTPDNRKGSGPAGSPA